MNVEGASARRLVEGVVKTCRDRPVVFGEDPAEYDALLQGIVEMVEPRDAIERNWARDLADAVWEGQRARRIKTQIFWLGHRAAAQRLVRNILGSAPPGAGDEDDIAGVLKAISRPTPESQRRLIHFLQRYGIPVDTLPAEVFVEKADVLEQAERMATAADKRRDGLIRQIEGRRSSRAQQFRNAAQFVEAQAEDVSAPLRRVSRRGEK